MRALKIILTVLALGVMELTAGPAPTDRPQLALVSVGLLVLSVGISVLAGYLIKKSIKTPLQEAPTPLATRGSYIAWIRGVRRLGYVLTWAGERATREEKGAGKGDVFDGPTQTVFTESGVHVLCVGTVDELIEIEAGGEFIFEGPINRNSHPSGTLVDLGGEGQFRMFWGEDDQPINDFLGDADRVGVTSRWPNFCYIEWRNRRLGPQPTWPFMSYTLRKEPSGDHLSDTAPWFDGTTTLTGTTYGTFLAVDGANDEITLQASSAGNAFVGNYTEDIRPGDTMRLDGNALPNQDLTVLTVTAVPILTGTPPFTYISGFRTDVIFEEDLTGIDTAGTIQLYDVAADFGANPAHAIADMLFDKWPGGLSLAKSDWDMDSLEAMGTLTLAESLRTSWTATEAATAQSTFGAGLQDLGYMVPIDPNSGLVKFQPIREDLSVLSNIDTDHHVGVLPELGKNLGEKPVDFLIFGFPDRDNNYRDMTVGRMEDGQIGLLEVARARNVPLTITTHYDTAVKMANRRSQEELAQASIWTLKTNRATREFIPGQAITANFTTEGLRVMEVKPIASSNKVDLKVMLDALGTTVQVFGDVSPPGAPGVTPVQQDITFAMIESSEYFVGVPPMTVLIPRIRAHAQVDSAALHLSADDITYTQVLTTNVHNPGGSLLTALATNGEFEPDDGVVQFTTLGPDIGNVTDFTGDDTSWRLGFQLCLLNSTAGIEICFLKKVTVVSGNTYSLDGLIRARFETRRLAHPAGAQVFIVNTLDMSPIQNALLAREVTRYAKTQPSGNGTVSLAAVDGTATALYGKGVRPVPVAALRVVLPDLVNAYGAGDSPKMQWDYGTPRTPGNSAGLQEGGQGVGVTLPEGSFQVELLTAADAVVRTVNVTDNFFTYSNANLVADLGGEVDFKIRVKQFRDGFESSTQTLTVEKI